MFTWRGARGILWRSATSSTGEHYQERYREGLHAGSQTGDSRSDGPSGAGVLGVRERKRGHPGEPGASVPRAHERRHERPGCAGGVAEAGPGVRRGRDPPEGPHARALRGRGRALHGLRAARRRARVVRVGGTQRRPSHTRHGRVQPYGAVASRATSPSARGCGA